MCVLFVSGMEWKESHGLDPANTVAGTDSSKREEKKTSYNPYKGIALPAQTLGLDRFDPLLRVSPTNKTVKIVIGVENILNLEHIMQHNAHIVFHRKRSQQRNQLIELLIRRIRIPGGNGNSIIHVESEGIERVIENNHLRLELTTRRKRTKSRFRDRRSLMYIPSFTQMQCSRFKQY